MVQIVGIQISATGREYLTSVFIIIDGSKNLVKFCWIEYADKRKFSKKF